MLFSNRALHFEILHPFAWLVLLLCLFFTVFEKGAFACSRRRLGMEVGVPLVLLVRLSVVLSEQLRNECLVISSNSSGA